jgi:hypothetical protein
VLVLCVWFGSGVLVDEKARTEKCEKNAILTCYVTTKSKRMLIDRVKTAFFLSRKMRMID